MRCSRGWNGWITGLMVVLLASLGLARPVAAQTSTSLVNGHSVTADGLTFTVSGCSLILNGVSSACSATNTAFTGATLEVSTDRGVDLTVVGSGASGNIFNAVNGGGEYDLSYTLNITKASGSPTVTNFSSTLAGSSSNHDLIDITSVDTLYSALNAGGSSPASQSLNVYSAASAQSSGFSLIPGSTGISETTNLELSPQSGTTLTLASLRQYYGPAPEPISLSVFSVGLVGLSAARRLRRKSADGKTV
jgi:hypothetical protein